MSQNTRRTVAAILTLGLAFGVGATTAINPAVASPTENGGVMVVPSSITPTVSTVTHGTVTINWDIVHPSADIGSYRVAIYDDSTKEIVRTTANTAILSRKAVFTGLPNGTYHAAILPYDMTNRPGVESNSVPFTISDFPGADQYCRTITNDNSIPYLGAGQSGPIGTTGNTVTVSDTRNTKNGSSWGAGYYWHDITPGGGAKTTWTFGNAINALSLVVAYNADTPSLPEDYGLTAYAADGTTVVWSKHYINVNASETINFATPVKTVKLTYMPGLQSGNGSLIKLSLPGASGSTQVCNTVSPLSTPNTVVGTASNVTIGTATVKWNMPKPSAAASYYMVNLYTDQYKNYQAASVDVGPGARQAVFTNLSDGTYYATVTAVSANGNPSVESNISNAFDIVGKMMYPVDVWASGTAAGNVTLHYRAPYNANGLTGYRIEYQINSPDWYFNESNTSLTKWVSVPANVDEDYHTYTVYNLPAWAHVSFRVAGKNSKGIGEYAYADGGTAAAEPRDFYAYTNQDKVDLSWSPSDYTPRGYKVQYSQNENFTGNVATKTYSANTTAVSLSGLKNGAWYYFRISIKQADGTYAPYYSYAQTYIADPYISDLTAKVSANAATFNWTAPTDYPVTGYRVEYTLDDIYFNAPKWMSVAANSTKATIFNLPTNAGIIVRIAPKTATGLGGWTYLTTRVESATIPAGYSASTSDGRITATWSQPAFPVMGYDIQWTTANTWDGASSNTIYAPEWTSQIINGMPRNTLVHIRISARTTNGNGPWVYLDQNTN